MTNKIDSETKIKVLTVVGARPNFMKVAPIIQAIRHHNKQAHGAAIEHVLVHTGQHYDALMSDRFFDDLGLPKPDVHLGVGSGSQAAQTAEILQKFENVLSSEAPDIVIVVGDVNSTVACALATAKLPAVTGKLRPLLAHVEAGLRSFDRGMPEEINRVVTDHLADMLFVTEPSGLANLQHEGIPSDKVFFVGNTMIDSLRSFEVRADQSPILDQLGLRARAPQNGGVPPIRPYALLTLHRPSNVDEAEAFGNILEGLLDVSRELPIIFPVHPRTRRRIAEFGFGRYFQEDAREKARGIGLTDPLGYVDFLCMMKNARLVLTDSGGIQEETTCLGVPCVTIRENTERPVTVEHGTNVLAGTSVAGIRGAIARQMTRKHEVCAPDKWDGKAADRIVSIIAAKVGYKAPHLQALSSQR
jgi:UDP-N-acetylglucosamine 2-epimerase (non-hydrolysing)